MIQKEKEQEKMIDPLWRLGIVVILIMVESFITFMESALNKANVSFFEKKVEEEQDKKAEIVLELLKHENWYINTAQIVRTTINLVIGAIYSAQLVIYAKLAGDYFGKITTTLGFEYVFLVLFTILLILTVMLFGLVMPGRLAGKSPELTAYKTINSMIFFIKIGKPFIVIINGAMKIVLAMLQIKPEELEDNVTEEEIISIVNEGSRQGVLEENEVEMISNIIEFAEKEARDVMTHRKKVVSINCKMSIEEALKFMLEEQYSRFPLYENRKDNVIGILHLKDVTQYYVEGKNLDVALKTLAREPYFVPDTQDLDVLFENMQSKKIHMAIVVDEYGQMAGIVAMEDIIEEIVGNIFDEYDIDERTIIKQGNGRYIIKGLATIDDIEDELGIEVEPKEFETLNGFLVYLLGHLPANKEKAVLFYKGYRFHILDANNNMIRTVKVVKETQKKIKDVEKK